MATGFALAGLAQAGELGQRPSCLAVQSAAELAAAACAADAAAAQLLEEEEREAERRAARQAARAARRQRQRARQQQAAAPGAPEQQQQADIRSGGLVGTSQAEGQAEEQAAEVHTLGVLAVVDDTTTAHPAAEPQPEQPSHSLGTLPTASAACSTAAGGQAVSPAAAAAATAAGSPELAAQAAELPAPCGSRGGAALYSPPATSAVDCSRSANGGTPYAGAPTLEPFSPPPAEPRSHLCCGAAAPARGPAPGPGPAPGAASSPAPGCCLGEDLLSELRCPITQEPMHDPVLAADGQTYERGAIQGGCCHGWVLLRMGAAIQGGHCRTWCFVGCWAGI